MLPQNLAFVDIETTGTSLSHDRIIEIGILRVEKNKLVKTFQTLINPQTHVSPFITDMTGIVSRELENAPTFYEVRDEILDVLKGATFVAHNARFDYGFLRHEFKRHETTFFSKHFCTVKLSRALFPRYKRHNLDSIIERFGFTCKKRHRAFDDAKILWDFYQLICKQFDNEKLLKAFDIITKNPSLPIGVSKDIIDKLPDSPGVYQFYDKNNAVLYIGKSVNIKNRVQSHFINDHTTSKGMNMCQQVRDITYIKTAGELGALILESHLIKKLQPLYNRQLRLSHKMIALTEIETKDKFKTVVLNTLDSISLQDLEKVMGICRSQRQAKEFLLKLAKEYFLCQKILGIEKTRGACFSSHLGWCKGACVGREHFLRYNIWFVEAFSKHKIKPWPFKGPIVIEDADLLEETKELFLVDKWSLVGTLKADTLGAENFSDKDFTFDYDTYKILARYLRDPKNQKYIRQVKRDDHLLEYSLAPPHAPS